MCVCVRDVEVVAFRRVRMLRDCVQITRSAVAAVKRDNIRLIIARDQARRVANINYRRGASSAAGARAGRAEERKPTRRLLLCSARRGSAIINANTHAV